MNEQPKIIDSFKAAELILKYLVEVLTDEEQTQLDAWIEHSDENRRLFSEMTNPEKLRPQLNEFESYDPDSGYERFLKKHYPFRVYTAKLIAFARRYSIAAALMIVLLGAGFVWFWKSNKPTYQTLTVPKDAKHELVLSDGTRISLNGSSTLTYPIAFTGKQRAVTLSGEGFFSVANPGMPFLVNIQNMNVQVAGSSFNIKAYTKEVTINSPKFSEVVITDTSITLDPHSGQPLLIEGQGKFKIIKQ